MHANEWHRILLKRIKAILQSLSYWGPIMGTRHIRNKLSNDFNVYWRRGWDSNPRWACTHSGFRDRRDRPLRHLSVPVVLSVAGFSLGAG